jgi:hypothetical protein
LARPGTAVGKAGCQRRRRTHMNRTVGISIGGLILLVIVVAIIF